MKTRTRVVAAFTAFLAVAFMALAFTSASPASAAEATSGTTTTATVSGWERCGWKILPGMSSKTNFCVDWVPSRDAYGNQVVRAYDCKIVNNSNVNVIVGSMTLGKTYDGYLEVARVDGANFVVPGGTIVHNGCGTLRNVWVPDPNTACACPAPDVEVFVNFAAARSGQSYVTTTVYDTYA
jgi:hypothetical protein